MRPPFDSRGWSLSRRTPHPAALQSADPFTWPERRRLAWLQSAVLLGTVTEYPDEVQHWRWLRWAVRWRLYES